MKIPITSSNLHKAAPSFLKLMEVRRQLILLLNKVALLGIRLHFYLITILTRLEVIEKLALNEKFHPERVSRILTAVFKSNFSNTYKYTSIRAIILYILCVKYGEKEFQGEKFTVIPWRQNSLSNKTWMKSLALDFVPRVKRRAWLAGFVFIYLYLFISINYSQLI